MAAWTTTVSFAGGYQRRADLICSGERAMYATFAFTLIASIGLWTALFTHDFSFGSCRRIPAEPADGLHLHSLLGGAGRLDAFLVRSSSPATARSRCFAIANESRQMMPWVTGTMGLITLFFLLDHVRSVPIRSNDWTGCLPTDAA